MSCDLTVGTPYAFQFTATGGVDPLQWQVTAGSLPPGLTLDEASGLLSGTPTEAGTFAFTIQVTDSNSEVATISCELEAEAASSGSPVEPEDEDCGCGAFWRSGYFGLDKPGQVKMMRHSTVVTDGVGFKIKRYLVDDTHPVTQPKIIEPTAQGTTETTEKFGTNLKARGESIEIQFPCADEPRSVLRLDHAHIPVSER